MSTDIVWAAFLLLGAVLEGYGIVSKSKGDTLSERLRDWFGTEDENPKAGRWLFSVLYIAVSIWFVPHIVVNGPGVL